MSDKIKAVKFVARTTARIGTATIVKAAIENNCEVETRFQRITVLVATAVIVGMSKNAVGAATDARVDEAVELYTTLSEKIKKTHQEVQEELETQPTEN